MGLEREVGGCELLRWQGVDKACACKVTDRSRYTYLSMQQNDQSLFGALDICLIMLSRVHAAITSPQPGLSH